MSNKASVVGRIARLVRGAARHFVIAGGSIQFYNKENLLSSTHLDWSGRSGHPTPNPLYQSPLPKNPQEPSALVCPISTYQSFWSYLILTSMIPIVATTSLQCMSSKDSVVRLAARQERRGHTAFCDNRMGVHPHGCKTKDSYYPPWLILIGLICQGPTEASCTSMP